MAVDEHGVLVGIWFSGCLSPFAFNLHHWLARCAQHRENGSRVSVSPCQCIASPQQALCSVSLSLPVYSLSTTSPMQCLLVAAGFTGCWEASTLNLQGRLLYNPTVEQAEKEETPNGCDSVWGYTRLMRPNDGSGGRGEDSQRLWRQKKTYRSIYEPTMEQVEEEKALNGCERGWGHKKCPLWAGKLFGQTWVGQIHQPWQATGLRETTLTKNISPSKSEGTSSHDRRNSCTYASFDHMAVQMTLDWCGVVLMDRSQVRTAPGPQPQRGPPHATDCGFGSPVARGRQSRATGDSKLAHWNAEGVGQRRRELQNFLKQNSIDVCTIWETHLTVGRGFCIRGWDLLGEGGRGG